MPGGVRKLFSPRGNESPREVIANTKATWTAWAQHAVGMAIVLGVFRWWCRAEDMGAILVFPLCYWPVAYPHGQE